MQPLLFWNNNQYAQSLTKEFQQGLVVTDAEALKAVIPDCKSYSSIIILCELNWSDNSGNVSLQNFQGIELAQQLRRQGINLPFIFTSFCSRKQILEQHPHSDILKYVGHGFVQLPASLQDYENEAEKFREKKTGKMRRLSPLELKDIQLFACNPEGIVNARVHQLTGLIEKVATKGGTFVKAEIEACIADIYAAFSESSNIFRDSFNRKFPEINKTNVEDAINTVTEEALRLTNCYKRKSGGIVTGYKLKPWQLLLIDDELDKNSQLIQALEKNGVKVNCTTNAKDAFRVLEKDEELRSKITVLLTDYRLFEMAADGVEVQQEMQGYSFLQEVGEKFYSRVITAVIYSGMPRQFLLDNLNNFKIKTEKFSKKDLKPTDPGAINYLVSRIVELGDKNYDDMLAFPLGSEGWKKHLHPLYLQYRNLADYETREREVGEFCKQWLEEFSENKNPPTPMIKGDAFNIRKKDSEEQTIERFIIYYKTRRLAQYLYLYFQYIKDRDPRFRVADLLMPGNKKRDKPKTIDGFYSQVLGWKYTEFPLGATMEELNWFEYDMGITILDDYHRFRAKMSNSENEVGDFIAGDRTLMNSLKENGFVLNNGPNGTLLFNEKNYTPYFFDKMDIGRCLGWLTHEMANMNKAGTEELIQLIERLSKEWKYEMPESKS